MPLSGRSFAEVVPNGKQIQVADKWQICPAESGQSRRIVRVDARGNVDHSSVTAKRAAVPVLVPATEVYLRQSHLSSSDLCDGRRLASQLRNEIVSFLWRQ